MYADMESRINRISEAESVDREEATSRIKKADKNRGEYYKYYTGHEWYDLQKYDILINTSTINFDEIVSTIKSFLKVKGFI